MALKQTMSKRLGMSAAAWVVGFLIFFPILWTFLASFKTEADAFAIPPKFLFFHWTPENYVQVEERSNYLLFAYNSIVLSVGPISSGSSSPSLRPGRWPSRRPSAPRTC